MKVKQIAGGNSSCNQNVSEYSTFKTNTLRICNINILKQFPHLPLEPHLEARVLQAPPQALSAPPSSALSAHPAPDSLHHSLQSTILSRRRLFTDWSSRCVERTTTRKPVSKCRLTHPWESSFTFKEMNFVQILFVIHPWWWIFQHFFWYLILQASCLV